MRAACICRSGCGIPFSHGIEAGTVSVSEPPGPHQGDSELTRAGSRRHASVRIADPLEDPWLGDEVLLVLEDFVVRDDADVGFPGLCFVEELWVGVAEPSDEDGEFRVLESVP